MWENKLVLYYTGTGLCTFAYTQSISKYRYKELKSVHIHDVLQIMM